MTRVNPDFSTWGRGRRLRLKLRGQTLSDRSFQNRAPRVVEAWADHVKQCSTCAAAGTPETCCSVGFHILRRAR